MAAAAVLRDRPRSPREELSRRPEPAGSARSVHILLTSTGTHRAQNSRVRAVRPLGEVAPEVSLLVLVIAACLETVTNVTPPEIWPALLVRTDRPSRPTITAIQRRPCLHATAIIEDTSETSLGSVVGFVDIPVAGLPLETPGVQRPTDEAGEGRLAAIGIEVIDAVLPEVLETSTAVTDAVEDGVITRISSRHVGAGGEVATARRRPLSSVPLAGSPERRFIPTRGVAHEAIVGRVGAASPLVRESTTITCAVGGVEMEIPVSDLVPHGLGLSLGDALNERRARLPDSPVEAVSVDTHLLISPVGRYRVAGPVPTSDEEGVARHVVFESGA